MVNLIKIDEISEAGLEIVNSFSEDWVEKLLMPQYESRKEALYFHLYLKKREKNIFVDGSIKINLFFICSRCAESVFSPLEHSFTHLFLPPYETGEKISKDIDFFDFEVSFHNGELVDIESLIAEEFVLSLPEYPLCKENCKGICPNCYTNLNEKKCSCKEEMIDSRWEKLKLIKLENKNGSSKKENVKK